MLLIGAGPAGAHTAIPRQACPGSALIRSAGVAWGTSAGAWTRAGGPPSNVMVSLAPTARARAATGRSSLSDRMWRDLHRCVAVPRALGPARAGSLRVQLLCHALWSAVPFLRLGGPAWDLEAWRPRVSRAAVRSPAQALDAGKRCNWGPDTGPPMPR